jgi:HEAT repeat protein
MKNLTVKNVMKNGIVIMITLFTLAASVQAQNINTSKTANEKRYARNLAVGISSENEGIKNSAIYYAGKYRITGTTNALIQQLKKEESPKTRALILYSLLRIGDDDGISAAYRYANGEMNEYVAKIFGNVTAEYDL